MNALVLANLAEPKMAVTVEPWAEIYYLRKGEEIRIQQPELNRVFFQVLFYPNGEIIVYLGGDYEYPLVFINNEEVQPFNDFSV